MKPFVAVASIWKLQIICRKDFLPKVKILIHLWHYHLTWISSNVELLRDNFYTPFLLSYFHLSHTNITPPLSGLHCYYFFPAHFHSHHFCWKMALEKNLFQAQTKHLAQLQNCCPGYWKMKSLKQVYFINMRSFSRIFYSINRNLLQSSAIKILYF